MTSMNRSADPNRLARSRDERGRSSPRAAAASPAAPSPVGPDVARARKRDLGASVPGPSGSATAPAHPAPAISEAAWQSRVLDLARLCAWRAFHDHDSRRNAAGLPDLLLVRADRLVAAELKAERGRLRRPQQEWLAALDRVPGIEAYVWRPSDWATVMAVLR